MLRFLLKRLPNIKQRHRFLFKIIVVSAVGHCLVMLIALLIAQFSSSYIFVLNKENMRKYGHIVLIPLERRIVPDILTDGQVNAENMQQEIANIEIQQQQEKLAATEFVEPQTMVAPLRPASKGFEKDEAETPKQEQLAQAVEEVMYVGREDLQELKLYNTVFNAIEKEWRPPVGFPSDSACEIAFMVSKKGKAHNIEILKSSSIAAYDIAARCAIARAHFERHAYGKKCTVVFKL